MNLYHDKTTKETVEAMHWGICKLSHDNFVQWISPNISLKEYDKLALSILESRKDRSHWIVKNSEGYYDSWESKYFHKNFTKVEK